MPSGGSRGRDRAVTVQIGAVILFGFLIIALSTYQATVVPDQNAEVEFLHNQEAQNDLIELSGSVAATGRTGGGAPATVKLGTRYPSRAFLINPPPATGRIQTVDPPNGSTVTLANVSVISSVGNESGDYWGDAANRNKSTRFVTYDPRYNEYREAPTTRIETGVVFNEFSPTRNITLTDQSIVQGDRVTLVTVRGNLSESGVSLVSIDPTAISSVSRRERVSGTLTLTIPTTLDNATWDDLLAEQIDEGWVNRTEQAGPNRVTIHLNDSRTYSLGIAAVGVGGRTSVSSQPAYLDVEQRPTEVSDGTTREVVVEVRDQFGNPVVGEEIDGYATTGTFVDGQSSTVRTDDDGRAVFEYTAGATDATLNFTFESETDPSLVGFDSSTAANASVDVTVNDGGGGGGANDPNPPDSVVLVESFRQQSDGSVAVLALENRGNETVNSSEARINFFAESGGNNPTEAVLTSASESPTLDIGGPLKNATIAFPPNTTKYVCYDFDQGLNQDEFFVTTYTFGNGADEQYFVGLNDQRSVTCDGAGGGGGGGGGGGASPSLQVRVDDLTRQNGNEPVFIGSYNVSNTNASFERVDVSFENQNNNAASDTVSSTATKAGLRYQNGYGSGAPYDVVFDVVYTYTNGTEYVAESVTVSDVADATNPSGNADLGNATSASFTSWEVRDQTNTNQNRPRYRLSYGVSSTAFSEVRAFALNLPGSGESGVSVYTAQSQNNLDIQFNFGANQNYRVGYLLRDDNGAVIAVVSVTDNADGTGTYSGP